MTDSERIKAIEKHSGFSTAALARHVELKNAQTLYDIHNAKHGISDDVANKILNKFKDIRPEWLRTGEGEMFKEPKPTSDTVSVSSEAWEVIKQQAAVMAAQSVQMGDLIRIIKEGNGAGGDSRNFVARGEAAGG